jgi:pyrroloquinoline quinone biosynthesis protein B
MSHSLIVLGSGQDGGTPQLGSRSTRVRERTASSLAITSDEHDPLLFDASPDIRRQYQRLCDHTGTAPDFDGVFITHGHMGHYAGLVHFGKEAAATEHLPLFAPGSVLSFLDANEPWATLFHTDHLDPVSMDDATASIGGLTVRAIPVPHRSEFTGTVAYSVSVGERPWLLYVPDIDGWDRWPAAERTIAEHPVSLLDATFSRTDELPGRDIAQIMHPLVPDTIERFAHLTGDRSVVLTHINHSNPLGDLDAEITSLAHDKGFLVAYDGMVLHHD